MTKNDDFSQMAYGPYTGSTLLVYGSQIVKLSSLNGPLGDAPPQQIDREIVQ